MKVCDVKLEIEVGLMIYPFPVDEKHIHEIKKINEYDMQVSTAYFMSVSITGIGYIFRPLITFIVYKLILHQPYVLEIPMRSEFFYNISKSPQFELSYLVCIFASIVACTMTVSFF
jgi:hypothetical protein